MVALSKYLKAGLKDATCKDIFHPGFSCSQHIFRNSPKFLTVPMKFFLPLVGIPLALKGRHLCKVHIYEAIRYYMELCVTGYLIGQSILTLFCLIRRLNGRFNQLILINLPVLLGTWSVLFTSDRVARLFTSSVFQVVLFSVIRGSKNPVLRFIRESKLSLTTLFMMCSSFILHNLQQHHQKIFWVVKPLPRTDEDKDMKCMHKDLCLNFCFTEVAKTALITVPFDLLKTLLNISWKKGTVSILKRLILNLDFPTTIFLAAYISIYRVTSCLLTRSLTLEPRLKHMIAAFLGGFAFYFVPKLPMLCYGVTVCIEIAYDLIKRNKSGKTTGLIDKFERYRLLRLQTIFLVTYMVNIYLCNDKYINSMGSAMISALTGHQAPLIKSNLHNYIKSLSY